MVYVRFSFLRTLLCLVFRYHLKKCLKILAQTEGVSKQKHCFKMYLDQCGVSFNKVFKEPKSCGNIQGWITNMPEYSEVVLSNPTLSTPLNGHIKSLDKQARFYEPGCTAKRKKESMLWLSCSWLDGLKWHHSGQAPELGKGITVKLHRLFIIRYLWTI